MPDPSGSSSRKRTIVSANFVLTRSPGRQGFVWIHLTGELDLSVVPIVAEQLREAQATSYLVVADLRELAFIDCAGLAVLVAAEREARRTKKSFVVMRGFGQVDRILAMTGISECVEVVDVRRPAPVAAALESLRAVSASNARGISEAA